MKTFTGTGSSSTTVGHLYSDEKLWVFSAVAFIIIIAYFLSI